MSNLRWRMRSANGTVVARSAEACASAADADRAGEAALELVTIAAGPD